MKTIRTHTLLIVLTKYYKLMVYLKTSKINDRPLSELFVKSNSYIKGPHTL